MGGAHNVALAHLSDPDNTMFAAAAPATKEHASPYEALIENKHYENFGKDQVLTQQDDGLNHQKSAYESLIAKNHYD